MFSLTNKIDTFVLYYVNCVLVAMAKLNPIMDKLTKDGHLLYMGCKHFEQENVHLIES